MKKINRLKNMDVDTPTPGPCPYCGRQNDLVSGERTPSVGDLAICYLCVEVARFDENLKQRKLTLEERLEVDGHPELERAKQAIRITHQIAGREAVKERL